MPGAKDVNHKQSLCHDAAQFSCKAFIPSVQLSALFGAFTSLSVSRKHKYGVFQLHQAEDSLLYHLDKSYEGVLAPVWLSEHSECSSFHAKVNLPTRYCKWCHTL